MSLDETWREHAACRGQDTNIWFDERHADRALRICAGCPVQRECGQYVVDVQRTEGRQLRGIWGGKGKPAGKAEPEARAQCGTYAGYRAHARRHEKVCDECLAARHRYRQGWQERQAEAS